MIDHRLSVTAQPSHPPYMCVTAWLLVPKHSTAQSAKAALQRKWPGFSSASMAWLPAVRHESFAPVLTPTIMCFINPDTYLIIFVLIIFMFLPQPHYACWIKIQLGCQYWALFGRQKCTINKYTTGTIWLCETKPLYMYFQLYKKIKLQWKSNLPRKGEGRKITINTLVAWIIG